MRQLSDEGARRGCSYWLCPTGIGAGRGRHGKSLSRGIWTATGPFILGHTLQIDVFQPVLVGHAWLRRAIHKLVTTAHRAPRTLAGNQPVVESDPLAASLGPEQVESQVVHLGRRLPRHQDGAALRLSAERGQLNRRGRSGYSIRVLAPSASVIRTGSGKVHMSSPASCSGVSAQEYTHRARRLREVGRVLVDQSPSQSVSMLMSNIVASSCAQCSAVAAGQPTRSCHSKSSSGFNVVLVHMNPALRVIFARPSVATSGAIRSIFLFYGSQYSNSLKRRWTHQVITVPFAISVEIAIDQDPLIAILESPGIQEGIGVQVRQAVLYPACIRGWSRRDRHRSRAHQSLAADRDRGGRK